MKSLPSHLLRILLLAATASGLAGAQANAVRWAEVNRQPAAWYATPEALTIADSILLFQTDSGGWPKNSDMTRPPDATFLASKAMDVRDPTIDNGATYTQMRYLAKVITAAAPAAGGPDAVAKYRAAFLHGFDYLLAAQYGNGGWPQYYPVHTGYYTHITFNDDAMIGVMELLRDSAAQKEAFGFVDEARRTRAAAAIAKGLTCILRCQITVNGVKTAWCAQHDELTFDPASARAYEHASISGSESVGVIRYLMAIEHPSPEVVASVNAAVAWLDKVKITGLRYETITAPDVPGGRDRVVRPDPAAPPLWARFYDISTNKPIFSGRDTIIRSALADIEPERRNGYSYYGTWGQALLEKEYPEWKKKNP